MFLDRRYLSSPLSNCYRFVKIDPTTYTAYLDNGIPVYMLAQRFDIDHDQDLIGQLSPTMSQQELIVAVRAYTCAFCRAPYYLALDTDEDGINYYIKELIL